MCVCVCRRNISEFYHMVLKIRHFHVVNIVYYNLKPNDFICYVFIKKNLHLKEQDWLFFLLFCNKTQEGILLVYCHILYKKTIY